MAYLSKTSPTCIWLQIMGFLYFLLLWGRDLFGHFDFSLLLFIWLLEKNGGLRRQGGTVG